MGLRRVVLGVCCGVLFCVTAMPQSKDVSPADKGFLKMAAEANMTEAHLGKAAEDQASQTSVKDYGQKLLHDHTEAYRELQTLAGKIGESIPNGIDISKNRATEHLLHLKGEQFDRQFVRHEIEDHEKAIAAFKREAQHGHDGDIKAYASKMIPVLESHLHMAQELAKTGKRS